MCPNNPNSYGIYTKPWSDSYSYRIEMDGNSTLDALGGMGLTSTGVKAEYCTLSDATLTAVGGDAVTDSNGWIYSTGLYTPTAMNSTITAIGGTVNNPNGGANSIGFGLIGLTGTGITLTGIGSKVTATGGDAISKGVAASVTSPADVTTAANNIIIWRGEIGRAHV